MPVGHRQNAPGKSDVVVTPDWVVDDMLTVFKPTGKILDSCRGSGAFYNRIPKCLWCEINEGRDFFQFKTRVDWSIGNPPYSLTRKWFQHSFKIADNICYLLPFRNFVSGYGLLKEVAEFGGMPTIRMYGTGAFVGFPMGNAIAAIHVQRGYSGKTQFSHYQEVSTYARKIPKPKQTR